MSAADQGPRPLSWKHRNDFGADCERGSGCGTRRVQHVQRVGTGDEAEFLHQLAGRRNCLGAHAGASCLEIVGLDFRNEALQ